MLGKYWARLSLVTRLGALTIALPGKPAYIRSPATPLDSPARKTAVLKGREVGHRCHGQMDVNMLDEIGIHNLGERMVLMDVIDQVKGLEPELKKKAALGPRSANLEPGEASDPRLLRVSTSET